MAVKNKAPREKQVVTFTIDEVSRIVGASRRRLVYWDKTKLISPKLEIETKEGRRRVYSVQDILAIKAILRLRQSAVPLQRIRTSLRYIKNDTDTLASSVILTDGKTIYLYQDDNLLVDTLKSGQAVLKITVQDLISEVQEKVNELYTEKEI